MQEYHLLRVENPAGIQIYHLNTGLVTIGRDSFNKIPIDDPDVARFHSLLRRFPSQTSQYAYELILGEGNVRLCKENVCHDSVLGGSMTLESGDSLQLGATQISYLIALMSPEEYGDNFDAQSIGFDGVSIDEEKLVTM